MIIFYMYFNKISIFDHFATFICACIITICERAYNLKLKLSLINLSNEQNKYLTIRNFMYVFHDEENYALYNLQKHGCVCAKQINERECCGSFTAI